LEEKKGRVEGRQPSTRISEMNFYSFNCAGMVTDAELLHGSAIYGCGLAASAAASPSSLLQGDAE
jgi:hypothetical protein